MAKSTDLLSNLIFMVNERKELDKEYKVLREKRKLLLKSIEEVETIISEIDMGKLIHDTVGQN
jgi:hypothetical protein